MGMTPPTSAQRGEGGGSGSVFGNIKTMTASEEKLVRVGFCPRCLPPEGRQSQMNLLGDFGPMRAFQCGRCHNVWVTSAPKIP